MTASDHLDITHDYYLMGFYNDDRFILHLRYKNNKSHGVHKDQITCRSMRTILVSEGVKMTASALLLVVLKNIYMYFYRVEVRTIIRISLERVHFALNAKHFQ